MAQTIRTAYGSPFWVPGFSTQSSLPLEIDEDGILIGEICTVLIQADHGQGRVTGGYSVGVAKRGLEDTLEAYGVDNLEELIAETANRHGVSRFSDLPKGCTEYYEHYIESGNRDETNGKLYLTKEEAESELWDYDC